jgi:2,3-bisphosphoglycerate-independent phosphoglycerate mutase
MGNSEVGHMNIGAGRVVAQDLPRIDVAYRGRIAGAAAGAAVADRKGQKRRAGGACDGFVVAGRRAFPPGSHRALVKIINGAGVPVSCMLSRRPRHPTQKRQGISSKNSSAIFHGLPVSGSPPCRGGYYAMDRDKRWDRVEKAYNAIIDASGRRYDDALAALDVSYAGDVTDEIRLALHSWRLCRGGGWRCVAVRQFPRRPGAGDFHGPARQGL